MLKIRKILCPLDFSWASLQGLQEAIQYTLHFDADLYVAHIAYDGIPMAADAVGYLTMSAELYEIPQREAETKLQEITDDLRAEGIRASYRIRAGEAGGEIVKMANELQVDLIVMATHSWTGWKRILFGSVAEKVVRYARCQVLTVPVYRANVKRIQGKRIPLALADKRKPLAAAARLKWAPQTSP